MRKRVLLFVLLVVALTPQPGSAEPLRVTSGSFLLDIEGDIFTFNGQGFSVATTAIGIYSNKIFPGHCGTTNSQLGFCPEAEGDLVDWSFHTTGGEQLLGTGNVTLDGTSSTGVDFLGSMRFDFVPTPLSSGGTTDFDFVAPFLFAATIRGVQGGEQLFARQFTGRGTINANYEGTLTPGVFSVADETIHFDFDSAPVPEPATLLLFGTGLAGAGWRRRRSAAVR